MHVVCASFVLFTEIVVYTTQLYNHYRIIVEENSVKYVPLDDLFGIQILPNSISAGAWGSLRRPPPDSTVGWGGAHPLPISMHVQTSLDAFSVSPTVPRHFHSRLSVVSFLIKHIIEKTRLHKDFLFSFRRNHAIRLLYHF